MASQSQRRGLLHEVRNHTEMIHELEYLKLRHLKWKNYHKLKRWTVDQEKYICNKNERQIVGLSFKRRVCTYR